MYANVHRTLKERDFIKYAEKTGRSLCITTLDVQERSLRAVEEDTLVTVLEDYHLQKVFQ